MMRGVGQVLPQIEPKNQSLKALSAVGFPAVSLGAVPKAWLPRRLLCGTPDARWLEDQWPLIPEDFDFAYWNCAPEDQQTPYLPPGTGIKLIHLYGPQQKAPTQADQEVWLAHLPARHPSVLWRLNSGVMLPRPLNLDTLVIDLDAQRIYATHRAVLSANADVRKVETLLMPWPEIEHG